MASDNAPWQGAPPWFGQSCPVECLLTVLSRMSFNPLTRAYEAPFDEPRTVGDVMDLYARRQLRNIRGLGPRRISEIEAALVLAGLELTQHPPESEDSHHWTVGD